ncbi:16S rRNA (cytosine(967)-C(5))-methyltransferase [Phormidium sp. LEGE 05292]|uniref:16S rRNA (cytosine(967)-C(5))-methyltransferase n=1 Tax=[Phormidium] sp. LEGE 05292 TaxID=767427 RepID=UPI00187E535F|nr:16S rRNA (cytosine(967)-C(5))-methyltransferase [Phormidium sp. LEGE 05292]MBE9229733.1 16S rRNA (cytosine(967)-C(5))-methyltransferase [Phormidium sp. LEGE 05292]
MNPQNPRQLAFLTLRDIHKGAYADVALDRFLRTSNLNDVNRRFATELVYGSVRRQRTLDTIIDQLGKKKANQQPSDIRTILHLGLYQLRYLTNIPVSAAINTTVELAKENKLAALSGVVNGLLRQYDRISSPNQDPLILPANLVARLGILYSFPDWIIQLWLEQWGAAETEQLCEWMNQTPAIDLRINPLKTTLEEVETILKSANILVKKIPHLPQALRLMGSTGAIQNLPGFQEGLWTVQDSSAQMVTHLLDPQPGEVIIDACAAPGGKTTHIVELMKDKGKVWAGDRTPSRLKKLQENAQRLNLKSIEICTGDSRNFPQFTNIADRVLLDVPCSGLGTLHRHADARWRQTPENVKELAALQKELLDSVSKYVKPGGILVYSTCTLHPLENEQVIENFLATHANWQIELPAANSPMYSFVAPPGWIKVLPHREQMDGFFMVRLRSTAQSFKE